jgi:hypothetical protein
MTSANRDLDATGIAQPPASDPWAAFSMSTFMDSLATQVAALVVARLAAPVAGGNDGDDLLSYEQIVDILTATTPAPAPDVKRPTTDYVRGLVKRGALPVVRFGKYVRV